ncbi:MAG: hypothetical protein ABW321_09110 [Polyangiales bacterium]
MKAQLKRHGVKLFVGLLGLYLLFVMDLGGRSFARHVVRVFKTPEMRELGSEIANKVIDVASGAKRRAVLALGPTTD